MKKIFSFVAAIMMATFVFAGVGFFTDEAAKVMITTNQQKEYSLNSSGVATIDLGKVTALSIDSFMANTWKKDGGNVCDVTIGYVVYKTAPQSSDWKTKKGHWLSGDGDQKWGCNVKDNVFSSLEDGEYTLEIYFEATGNGSENKCDQKFHANNGSSNYKFTFLKGDNMFAKNTWEGTEWTWKQMTKVAPDTFALNNVVFGGGGLSINQVQKEDGRQWFDIKRMKYTNNDTIQAKDTVNFLYAVKGTDTTLTATLVGRPKMVEIIMVQDTLWSANGAKVTAWAWESGKEGEWSEFATNRNDTLILKVNERADSIIFVRMKDSATKPGWSPKWNEIAKSEIAECLTFYITDWNKGVWCERPCKNDFGILVNGEYQAAAINPEHKEGVEYMLIDVVLKENDSVQLYNNCAKEAWIIEDYMEGSYQFKVANGKYVVSDSDKYDLYFQLGPDKIWIKKHNPTYYIAGNEALVGSGKEWAPDAIKMKSGVYTFTNLNVGRYKMKVTEGVWEGALTYDSLNTEASSANISTDDDKNICFLVNTATDVVVKVVDRKVVVTGTFAEPCDGKFGIMVNSVYKEALVNPDRTDKKEYMLKDVALNAKDTVQMYDNCTKTGWLIRVYREGSYVFGCTDDQQKFLVSETGEYDFYFTLGSSDSSDSLYVYKHFVPAPDFGINVNGVYRAGEESTIDGGKQYRVDAVLQVSDKVQVYDNLNQSVMTLTLAPAGYTNFTVSGADMTVREMGEYKFFINIMTDTTQSNLLVEYKGGSGLDDVYNAQGMQNGKMIENGQLIIRRNGAIYTPVGVRVK